MELSVKHDPVGQRFYATTERGEAVLRYVRVNEDTLDFFTTWVPRLLRGKGIGSALVEGALRQAGAQGLRVIPTCPFVEEVARQTPELEGLLRR